MIRRLKADVLSELPAKRRQKIEVQVDPKLKKEVEKILNGFDNPGGDGDSDGEEETANTRRLDHYGIRPISFDEAFDDMRAQSEDGGQFMTAYRLTGEAKVAGAIEFIDTLLEAGAKFLLFAHHKCVLDAYEDFCSR